MKYFMVNLWKPHCQNPTTTQNKQIFLLTVQSANVGHINALVFH